MEGRVLPRPNVSMSARLAAKTIAASMEGRVLPRPNMTTAATIIVDINSFNGGSGITPTE